MSSNNLESKMEELVDLHGSSCWQFYRTTFRIQLESGSFEKSRLILTFLTIFGFTEISCRFFLKEKAGGDITESLGFDFSKKISPNNYALSDVKDNSSGLLNGGGIGELPFIGVFRALSNS